MLRVAIVEDDPDMRELVRRWVIRDGHKVVAEAMDGADGIDVAGIYRPDVLVLDVQMPVLDGCHAIPGILRASPGTVIVVFSFCVDRRDGSDGRGAHLGDEDRGPPSPPTRHPSDRWRWNTMKRTRGVPSQARCQVTGCARPTVVNVPRQQAAPGLSLSVAGRSYVRICGRHHGQLVAEPDVPEPA